MHYHGKVGLVDRLDYKLSTLSSDFKNARMFTFTHENELSLIPIVEFRDTIEVVGQYFGEGYRLAVCRRHWPMIVESLKEQSGKPLNIDYVGERYIGMKEATKQSAVLTLSRPDAMQEYSSIAMIIAFFVLWISMMIPLRFDLLQAPLQPTLSLCLTCQ
jgi:hypothetical protein